MSLLSVSTNTNIEAVQTVRTVQELSSASVQDLVSLIKNQSYLIENLHKTIEGLNARLERFEKIELALVSKNVSKDVSKDVSRDVSRDVSSDVSKDVSSDVVNMDVSNSVIKEVFKECSKSSGKSSGKSAGSVDINVTTFSKNAHPIAVRKNVNPPRFLSEDGKLTKITTVHEKVKVNHDSTSMPAQSSIEKHMESVHEKPKSPYLTSQLHYYLLCR